MRGHGRFLSHWRIHNSPGKAAADQRRDQLLPKSAWLVKKASSSASFRLPKRMAKAEAAELDLVEIAPTAKPPVCRIMDYGKFKYREAKKQHEAKLKLKQIQVKEVKFRPGTDEGDYKIKLRNLIRFLDEGDKAKITLRFRGREMAHQEFGMRLLERIRNDLEPYSVVEQWPRLEGRQMVMLLAPKKTVIVAESIAPPSPKPVQPSSPKPLRRKRGEHRRGQQIKEKIMPKMKTKTGAEEALPRARQRQRSSARRRSSATSSPRRPPRASVSLRGTAGIHSTNMDSVRAMLPYA